MSSSVCFAVETIYLVTAYPGICPGADGIHSAVRPCITKANLLAQPTGVSLYRFTVPIKDALAVLDHVPQPLDPAAGGFVNVFLGGDGSQRNIVMYPCRNFELLNVACCVPDNLLVNGSVESWRATGEVSEMLQQFDNFPKWILDIMRYVIVDVLHLCTKAIT